MTDDRPALLRAVRKRLKLTQADMGKRLGGISDDSVRGYENGTRPIPGTVWQLLQLQRLALGEEL